MTFGSPSVAEIEKRGAARSSVVAAVFLTLLKMIVGLLTGSLGILAEAAHSGLDLVAALVTLFAVRYSDQPPDAQHLYGHGKMEHLSALIEALLLLLTSIWIIYEAIQRLFFKSVEVEATLWAFLTMATSVVVDITRSRMLHRTARKHNSQALEADALHFSTDIWSSLTVIAGLGLVWLSQHLGHEWAWLAKADAVAATMVAVIVIYVSLQLGRRAVSGLLDAAPPGLAERIGEEVARMPGVQTVGQVRVRQSGPSTFVDLTVGVERSAALEQAHQVAAAVEKRVTELAPHSDVVVHVDPVQQVGESLPQAVGAIAGRMGLHTHNIHAHGVHGSFFVDLDVEVPADLTLDEAHDQVSRFEAVLYDELPYVREINTHMEPIAASVISTAGAEAKRRAQLQAQILALVKELPELRGCHNLHIWPGQDGYDVVLHCRADRDLPIVAAHQLAEQLEQQLHALAADISQVLVHIEPENGR
jgi:cation diffusion facilitator family transporter